MEFDDTTERLPWETPTTIAITDTESRADQPDVAMRNGQVGGPSNPG
jgi:hypothetical protein